MNGIVSWYWLQTPTSSSRYASPWGSLDRRRPPNRSATAPAVHEARQVVVDHPLLGLLQDLRLGEAGRRRDHAHSRCSGSRP